MTQTNDPVDDNLADPEGQEDQTHTEVDEENIKTEEVDLDDSVQTDYKEKASQSFKEAMKLKQEKEALESDNIYYKNLSEVAKDSAKLHEIAKSNPEMANRITKEYGWGDTYQEAVNATSGEEKATEIDPMQAARAAAKELKQVDEKKAIEDFEVQFFIDNGIAMGTPKHKAIMSTYSRFPVETMRDSQELLTMAHSRHNPNVEVELPTPNGDFGSKGKIKSEFTEGDRKIMSDYGWDAKKMRAFKADPLYATTI